LTLGKPKVQVKTVNAEKIVTWTFLSLNRKTSSWSLSSYSNSNYPHPTGELQCCQLSLFKNINVVIIDDKLYTRNFYHLSENKPFWWWVESAELDKIDRTIISLLAENPEISQREIADILKISQPAVSMRVRELKRRGIITHFVGVNLERSGLCLAKVDIVCSDTEPILKFFEKCPRCWNVLVTSGRHNLCLFFVSEDLKSLHACINQHIRKRNDIKEVEFNLVITPLRDLIIPLRVRDEREEISPCEKSCGECTYYALDRCLGCPRTIFYKGNILG